MSQRGEIIERLLRFQPDGVVVGGYALKFYAQRYGIDMDDSHPAATFDLDLLASRFDAEQFKDLISFTFDVKITVDENDHASPNTAVLVVHIEGEKDPLIIDYLAFLVGLGKQEVLSRAIAFEIPGKNMKESHEIRVMHPLDVLFSRIFNVVRLPSKRHSRALAQVDLAFDMIRAWLHRVETEGNTALLKSASDEIKKLAQSKDGRELLERHGKNVLNAIPKGLSFE